MTATSNYHEAVAALRRIMASLDQDKELRELLGRREDVLARFHLCAHLGAGAVVEDATDFQAGAVVALVIPEAQPGSAGATGAAAATAQVGGVEFAA